MTTYAWPPIYYGGTFPTLPWQHMGGLSPIKEILYHLSTMTHTIGLQSNIEIMSYLHLDNIPLAYHLSWRECPNSALTTYRCHAIYCVGNFPTPPWQYTCGLLPTMEGLFQLHHDNILVGCCVQWKAFSNSAMKIYWCLSPTIEGLSQLSHIDQWLPPVARLS